MDIDNKWQSESIQTLRIIYGVSEFLFRIYKTFQIIQNLFRLSRNFQGYLEAIYGVFWEPWNCILS